MDPNQFQQFMQQDHAAKQEQVNQWRAQAAQYRETAERQKAQQQAQRVQHCDGSSTRKLREWFREIELTVPYSNKTVLIASLTAEGPLRSQLEKYLSEQPQRDQVTWDALKQELQTQFLSQHEAERLRDEVEKVKQEAYETTAAYGRRFREAADLGYPAAQRNADQQRLMLRCYMRGLKNRELVGRLVQEARPADYLDAITAVAQYESDRYNIHRALHGVDPTERTGEEAMEVNSLREPARGAAGNNEAMTEALAKLQRQVAGLSREFTKLKAGGRDARPTGAAASSSRPPGSQDRRRTGPARPQGGQKGTRKPSPFKFTEDGRPICAHCDKPGHVKAECRSRVSGSAQPTVNAMPRGGY